MLQVLLKDRFQLRFHVEKREQKVYALVPNEGGLKLKKSIPLAPDDNTPLKPGELLSGEGQDRHKERFAINNDTHVMHVESDQISMKDFIASLTASLRASGDDTPVIDRTGLQGNYQVALDAPMYAWPSSDGASDPISLDPITSSLSKLGLRLEKQKAQVDTYVIDHAEKPSEN